MKIIINRGSEFSTIDGVFVKTDEAMKLVNEAIKKATAKLLVDAEETLMYNIATP